MKKRRRKTLDPETVARLLPCMRYLHGDVVDDQFRAACQYEYARESKILRKAAESLLRNSTAYVGEIVSKIEHEFHCGTWFIGTDWMFVWQCLSFPAKSWNQLSEAERTELLYGLPASTTKVQPLRLAEVIFLTAYLEQFKEKAEQARTDWEEARTAGRPREKIYPILELPNTPFVQALLPLDFSKSKKRLLQEIGKWLDLSENKARFDKQKQRTEAGTAKQAKDRLKDLSAWRLYRELGCDEALKFAQRNRKSGQDGKPRKFHDWRQDQTKKLPPNEAPLYSEESGFLKAKARALKHRAELIPWEFGKYAEEREQQKREWEAAFRKVLKEPKKISRSSS